MRGGAWWLMALFAAIVAMSLSGACVLPELSIPDGSTGTASTGSGAPEGGGGYEAGLGGAGGAAAGVGGAGGDASGGGGSGQAGAGG